MKIPNVLQVVKLNFFKSGIIIIILCVMILFDSCSKQRTISADDTITMENVYSVLHELIKDDTLFNHNYEENLILINTLFAIDFSADNSSFESYTNYISKIYHMNDKEKYDMIENKNEVLKYQSCVLNKCINYKITFKNLLQEISKTVYNKNYKSELLEDLLNCDDRADISIEKLDSLNESLDKALKSLKNIK